MCETLPRLIFDISDWFKKYCTKIHESLEFSKIIFHYYLFSIRDNINVDARERRARDWRIVLRERIVHSVHSGITRLICRDTIMRGSLRRADWARVGARTTWLPPSTVPFHSAEYRWYLKPKSPMMGRRHVLLASITCREFPITLSNFPVRHLLPRSKHGRVYPAHLIHPIYFDVSRIET